MASPAEVRKIFTLSQVAQSIEKALAECYTGAYWIQAEIIRLNHYSRSGHCYPDLVEKRAGKVVAQFRGVIWQRDFARISAQFERTLHEPLRDGIKILLLASVKYNPQYGLTLHIADIDPAFTLGDLEREKQETWQRLQQEGLLTRNQRRPMPLLPQRVAVVSVETSRGYADFIQVLAEAERRYGYRFFYLLFPSLLQGDGAVATLVQQLARIRRVAHHFDVVAIVRGGGGDAGLACYNHYDLARAIAEFPLPVLTGIGHATNETVAEKVACQNAITPTQLAESLVRCFDQFALPLRRAEERVAELSRQRLAEATARFAAEVRLWHAATRRLLAQQQHTVQQHAQTLLQQTQFGLRREKERLRAAGETIRKESYQFCAVQAFTIGQCQHLMRKETARQLKQSQQALHDTDQRLAYLRPENVLRRGYSITLRDGKALLTAADLRPGQTLRTLLADGQILSTVISLPSDE